MERLSTIVIFLIFIGCSNSSQNKEQVSNDNEGSSTSLFYDVRTISEVRTFIEANHMNSACANELLVTIFEFSSFFHSVGNSVVDMSGGIDLDGRLLFPNRDDYAAALFETLEFDSKFQSFMSEIEKICTEPETFGRDILLERIHDSVGILRLDNYSKIRLRNLTVSQLYDDMLFIESGLLFTEMMYFELLISNDQCQESPASPSSEARQ